MSSLFSPPTPPPPPMLIPPPPKPVPKAPDLASPNAQEAALNKVAGAMGQGREASNLTRQRSPGEAAAPTPEYSGKTLG